MPEADLRANQQQPPLAARSDTEPLQPASAAGGFEDLDPHPTDTSAPLPQQPEEGWQTVNFPNAISVDAIPTKPEAKNSQSQTPASGPASPPISDNLKNLLASVEQAKAKGATPVTLMQALHECNRDLLGRIAQLETALEESQNSLQARETLLAQRNAELQESQEQLTRLFARLEVSNQTLQKQEVLVESLSNESAATQSRLAAIERECASTQQRYNEQLHQLVATENVCRELRSRLHRQQRHTLQFKAALERSLEMPHLNSPVSIEPPENADDIASAHLESLLAVVKAQSVPVPPAFNPSPVKTWSDRAEQHPDAAEPEKPTGPELDASQELQTLAAASGMALQRTGGYRHLEPTTEIARKVAEPQLPLAESGSESAAKLNSPELTSAAQILSAAEISGIQEVREKAAASLSARQPEWAASISNPLTTAKKRRSLAEIELPSFK